MKRFLAMVLLIILLVVVITLSFIVWGAKFSAFGDQEKAITSFLLTSLALIGLVVSIAIVAFILYQYIRYRRPYRLVFEAFSNESELIDTENKPLDLSILAQEELVRQFKIIYNDLKEYSDKINQEFEALVADELYIEEDPSGTDIAKYVSSVQIRKGGMIEDLKEVIRDLKDPKGMNLMNLVGEIAPKQVTPVMKFVEAIIPPHVIRATGHLQSKSDKSGTVGITFEFVDLSNQHNLMVRTLWQSADNVEDSAESTATSNTPNKAGTNNVADRYIKLLRPAMYWVALMFWEQKLLSNVPLINRILPRREKRRKARILYLLGALYYAHADQFAEYKPFFEQLAVEHLRPAMIADPTWGLPDLYLANLYSFKAQEKEGELHKLLLNEAFTLYDQVLELAKEKGQKSFEARIIVAKALAELTSGLKTNDDRLIDKAALELEDMKTRMDPADFNPAREDCAAYLYNLATWYQVAYDGYVHIPNGTPRKEARRYLAYSLVRSLNFWNTVDKDVNFESMRESGDVEKLKQELRNKLDEDSSLKTMTGEQFRTEIGRVLAKIDQLSGRPTG